MYNRSVEYITIAFLLGLVFFFFNKYKFYKSEFHHVSMSFSYAQHFIKRMGLDKKWLEYISKIGE